MAPQLTQSEFNSVFSLYNNGTTWEQCSAATKIFQSLQMQAFNDEVEPASEYIVKMEENLPRLSWLCEIRNGIYTFHTGPGVECSPDFIVEGVWDGDFKDGKFDDSDHFYGSGACLKERCIFVPPKLCTDFLFVLHDSTKSISWVSNSFNFIFARAGISLQSEFYKNFAANLNKSTNEHSALGPDLGNPLIAKTDNLTMYRMMYHNFMVDGKGNIRFLMRIPPKLNIKNFSDYRTFLSQKISTLLANGLDKARKNPFGSISMLSTGYDSCATSAISSQCGVKDAVTLDVTVSGHNDCGEEIAKTLGMNCFKVASPLGSKVNVLRAALSKENFPYLEFMATAGIGDNLVFKEMEPVISNKMVFSGLYGDGCWSKEGNGSGLAHHLPYMKSRMEFRLRSGYCLIPVPAFGAYYPYFLKKLNAASEMQPWTLNTTYDRPVARRLAEEAGVPRQLFGMKKAANNPDIVNYSDLFDSAVEYVSQRYKKKTAN